MDVCAARELFADITHEQATVKLHKMITEYITRVYPDENIDDIIKHKTISTLLNAKVVLDIDDNITYNCTALTARKFRCNHKAKFNSPFCGLHKINQPNGVYTPGDKLLSDIQNEKDKIPTKAVLDEEYKAMTELTTDDPNTGEPVTYLRDLDDILYFDNGANVIVVGLVINSEIHWFI